MPYLGTFGLVVEHALAWSLVVVVEFILIEADLTSIFGCYFFKNRMIPSCNYHSLRWTCSYEKHLTYIWRSIILSHAFICWIWLFCATYYSCLFFYGKTDHIHYVIDASLLLIMLITDVLYLQCFHVENQNSTINSTRLLGQRHTPVVTPCTRLS